MKKVLSSMLLVLFFVLLAACTTENDTSNVNSNQEQIELSEKPETNTEVKLEEPKIEDSSITNPVLSVLEEVMTNTISTESVSFTTSTEETTYFISQDDSVNENYQIFYDYIYGYLDTENAYVDLNREYSHSIVIPDSANFEEIDSFEGHTKIYFNSNEGIYKNVITDNMWYKEAIPAHYKTIDNLADIVNDVFLANYEHVVLEEITAPEDVEYGNKILMLELPNDLFLNHMIDLSMNFFNGYYYSSEEYELDKIEDPARLNHNYASLIVNENNQVSAFFVSYSTTLEFGSEEDYYSFYTRTNFFDYNMTTVEAIPDEGYINAVAYDSYE